MVRLLVLTMLPLVFTILKFGTKPFTCHSQVPFPSRTPSELTKEGWMLTSLIATPEEEHILPVAAMAFISFWRATAFGVGSQGGVKLQPFSGMQVLPLRVTVVKV